jgi:hypothetical protein
VSEPSVPTTIASNTARAQVSLTIAMTIPASTNSTISACVHTQNGDTATP